MYIYIYIYQISLIIEWMSIRANVSILFNQITLIIKWMSILANPFSRIVKSKVFNLKMDEH